MKLWNLLEDPETIWLVDGLIPADGDSAIVGKPKSGKSTLINNLTVCVIKSPLFLGRAINLTAGTGRVLYIHLDRKGRPGRVASELKNLGIASAEEVSRLEFIISTDLSASKDERMTWLRNKVEEFRPHLVVIELMLQFIDVENSNDYKQTLTAINKLQDCLALPNHKSALMGSFHARKSTSLDSPADDILGSTAIRGSFGTLILLGQEKSESESTPRYTIMSDQTDREAPWGELGTTEIIRNVDGTMSLGQSMYDLQKVSSRARKEEDNQRLLNFLIVNAGSTTEQMMTALRMSKPKVLHTLKEVTALLSCTGAGIKGDPKILSVKPVGKFDEPVGSAPGEEVHRPTKMFVN